MVPIRLPSFDQIRRIGTGRQCHRFIIALARQKTRFIVIGGVLADMRTARVADRLLSKHDGSRSAPVDNVTASSSPWPGRKHGLSLSEEFWRTCEQRV